MAYWLMKTEPSTYSYETLVQEGSSVWDGVTNALALRYIRAMKKGDRALIYHTGSEKAVVGIAEVTANPYPDPKRGDPKLVVVMIGPGEKLQRKVPFAEIKGKAQFASFELVRLPRLSVMPVEAPVWNAIVKLSKQPPGKD